MPGNSRDWEAVPNDRTPDFRSQRSFGRVTSWPVQQGVTARRAATPTRRNRHRDGSDPIGGSNPCGFCYPDQCDKLTRDVAEFEKLFLSPNLVGLDRRREGASGSRACAQAGLNGLGVCGLLLARRAPQALSGGTRGRRCPSTNLADFFGQLAAVFRTSLDPVL